MTSKFVLSWLILLLSCIIFTLVYPICQLPFLHYYLCAYWNLIKENVWDTMEVEPEGFPAILSFSELIGFLITEVSSPKTQLSVLAVSISAAEKAVFSWHLIRPWMLNKTSLHWASALRFLEPPRQEVLNSSESLQSVYSAQIWKYFFSQKRFPFLGNLVTKCQDFSKLRAMKAIWAALNVFNFAVHFQRLRSYHLFLLLWHNVI